MEDIYNYLFEHKESIPSWLNDYEKGKKPSFETLLKSRIVYYPGAGVDGQPIKTFNKSQFAHIFFYVDYGRSKEEIVNALTSDESIRGYRLVDLFNYNERELSPHGWTPHYQLTDADRANMNLHEAQTPFCILAVFEREANYDESHGSKRFAVLYLCGDAIASYDAIFANRGIAPTLIILQDHGFGGNYNWFGDGGALYKIANSTNTIPQYALIADNTAPWREYNKIQNITHVLGSGHLRWLYKL